MTTLTSEMTPRQAREWLRQQFEFNYCEECHGNAKHHELCAGPFGLPFARCLYPMTDDDKLHPVIRQYHESKGNHELISSLREAENIRYVEEEAGTK